MTDVWARRAILISSPARSPPAQPSTSLPSSQSLPPSSFREFQGEDETTPKQDIKQWRRRNSDRIRSPSDSSSISSEDEQGLGNLGAMPIRQPLDRQTSAPPSSKSFPAGLHTAGSSVPRPPMPRRPKTLSDPHLDSPLAARMASRNAAGPPSAFGSFGSFTRPSPASRRRRGSQSAYGSESEDGDDNYRPIPRSMSARSVSQNSTTSSTWPKGGSLQPTSPVAPDGVDSSPFHHRTKSPESVAGIDHEVVDISLQNEDGEQVEIQEEDFEETEDTLGDTLEGVAMDPRLSRLSVSVRAQAWRRTLTAYRPAQASLCAPHTTSYKPFKSIIVTSLGS